MCTRFCSLGLLPKDYRPGVCVCVVLVHVMLIRKFLQTGPADGKKDILVGVVRGEKDTDIYNDSLELFQIAKSIVMHFVSDFMFNSVSISICSLPLLLVPGRCDR